MENRTEIVEVPELIAVRVPPGDKWILKDDPYETIHPSLTDVLEAYFQTTEFKGEYRLAPLDSKLYALKSKEQEIIIKEEPEKRYGLFGEFKQGA
jgi:hypothetical protein